MTTQEVSTLERTLAFVNDYRKKRGKAPLEALPKTIGKLANQNALSLGLGVSVVRHGGQGLLYALTRQEDVVHDLLACGATMGLRGPAVTRQPELGTIYEVNLPRYCYEHVF